MNWFKIGAGVALAGTAIGVGEYAIAKYFFVKTMIRIKTKVENTKKMAGTDWDKYTPKIRECKIHYPNFVYSWRSG